MSGVAMDAGLPPTHVEDFSGKLWVIEIGAIGNELYDQNFA